MKPHTSPPDRSVRSDITTHSPRARLDSHNREVNYLSIVLAGSYVERIGQHSVDCLPLGVRFHPAHEEHSHDIGRMGARCLNIELGTSWGESLERLVSLGDRPIALESGGWWALQADALHRSKSPDSELDFDSITAELLSLCERQARIGVAHDKSVAIRRAMNAVEDSLCSTISLSMLAAVAGLHPTHFARSFRKTTGMTAGQYVRWRRVARAQMLLANTPTLSISRVAAESGFADHAHLTRTFREVTGSVPRRYKAALALFELSDGLTHPISDSTSGPRRRTIH